MRVHAAMNLAGLVAPSLQMLPEIGQGAAMFSEDEQLAAAVA